MCNCSYNSCGNSCWFGSREHGYHNAMNAYMMFTSVSTFHVYMSRTSFHWVITTKLAFQLLWQVFIKGYDLLWKILLNPRVTFPFYVSSCITEHSPFIFSFGICDSPMLFCSIVLLYSFLYVICCSESCTPCCFLSDWHLCFALCWGENLIINMIY